MCFHVPEYRLSVTCFYGCTAARRYEAEALALHEAIPGHHTQTMVAAENDGLPPFRRFMDDRRYSEAPGRYPIDGAFIEGWGLYSESLGKDLGCYEDPFQLIGRLSAEAFRSCRLVVDTGLHAKGWTVDEAKAFMLKHTAASEGNVDAEVKRYATWPGQATGYKVSSNREYTAFYLFQPHARTLSAASADVLPPLPSSLSLFLARWARSRSGACGSGAMTDSLKSTATFFCVFFLPCLLISLHLYLLCVLVTRPR